MFKMSRKFLSVVLIFAVVFTMELGFLAPVSAGAASNVDILKEFDMEQVKVTDSYYVNAFNKDVSYLLSLDTNRLLVGFKAVSEDKDPKTATGLNLYGGWEGAWSLLRGHTMGHYLSAMAQAYKQTKGATNNTQIKQNIDYTISQLKAFQDKKSNGYLFASPEGHFDIIEGKGTGSTWVPWYTLHKIISGLLDVYKYEGNATALTIASKLGDWAYNRSKNWSSDTQKKVLGVEYGGMNDCMYDLYKYTNNANHLAVAHKFDEDSFFTPLSNGTNNLENKHANTHIPKIVGALNRYRTLGTSESFYLKTAQQFFNIVLRDHTYVTGGNSENEHFRAPGKLDATRDNINDESCNSYNMLKLARNLFKVTGDVKYADYYERTFINEIMASINPDTGMTTYFKPMGTGYFKLFGTATNSFWCCTGTGMENFTKLNDSLYFNNGSDLYVNTYLSSTLNWSEKGLSLTQSANLPLSDKVTFTINSAPTSAVKIKFRSPYWVAAGKSVTVTVNGEAFSTTKTNGYLDVSRVWKAGDKVELTFPMEVQASRLPDNQNAVAFTYGPVVLSAGLGTERMESTGHLASSKATIPSGVVIKDYIVLYANSTTEWLNNIKMNLVQTSGKLEFTLKNTDSNNTLKFTPYYSRYKDRYGIYFKLTADPTVITKIIQQNKRDAIIADATIDEVQVTNDQHELVHNLQGNSSGGSFNGHNYRHANGTTDGAGWLSYDMQVDPSVANYIVTKYYSGDSGRNFNVYVNNQLIAQETIKSLSPAAFYDVRYQIPSSLLAGKTKVTVKFANRGNSYVGGIFDKVSIVKDYSNNADLSGITVNGISASLSGTTYSGAVLTTASEASVKYTPVKKNSFVYINNILIDDTQNSIVKLSSTSTTINIKVVAEDEKTSKTYTLNITKSLTSTPTNTPTVTPPISDVLYGDVNGDNTVDSADYTLLRKLLLGIITELPAKNWKVSADLNTDGSIDSADYTLMRKFLLGIITVLPVK